MGQIDSRELLLFIENDREIYNQLTVPTYKNLIKKKKSGTYVKQRALISFKRISNAGAKRYAREFARPSEWNVIFSVSDRNKVARMLQADFDENWEGII